jgi:hypothetical protein
MTLKVQSLSVELQFCIAPCKQFGTYRSFIIFFFELSRGRLPIWYFNKKKTKIIYSVILHEKKKILDLAACSLFDSYLHYLMQLCKFAPTNFSGLTFCALSLSKAFNNVATYTCYITGAHN